MTLKEGEEFLSIKIVGHQAIAAFKNEEGKAKNPAAPDYKGDGIAIWVNKKKATQPITSGIA